MSTTTILIICVIIAAIAMITERLYYTDAYTTTFQAAIIERVHHKKGLAIVLDRTYFYPESGGQPADTGWLNNTAVSHVEIRPTDGAILHWVADDIWSEEATGKINWARRFDHMQQHTGQHILSQAFIQTARAETIGFHLTGNTLTIDLHTNNLTAAQIQDAETLANEIIWQNRPIHVHFATLEQAKKLPLRKIPPVESGKLRLIEVKDFDLTACGGTHVQNSGSVGQIKITKIERRGEQLRVSFVCGKRALLDYRYKNSIINQLTTNLTTGANDILPAIAKLQDELKNANRTLRQQQEIILQFEAQSLLEECSPKGKVNLVTHVFSDRGANEVRQIGQILAKQPKTIALLALAGSKTTLFFTKSEDAPGQMDVLLKTAVQMLEGGGGGGSEFQAQGGGPPVPLDRLQQILNRASKLASGQIK